MANKKVLIIEDEVALNETLSDLLGRTYKIYSAVDGPDGLKKIQKEKPDLVLLDIFLPGMDGFEILEKIQKDKKLSEIPVIILSNCGGQKDIERGLELGAKEFLIKANTDLKSISGKVASAIK